MLSASSNTALLDMRKPETSRSISSTCLHNILCMGSLLFSLFLAFSVTIHSKTGRRRQEIVRLPLDIAKEGQTSIIVPSTTRSTMTTHANHHKHNNKTFTTTSADSKDINLAIFETILGTNLWKKNDAAAAAAAAASSDNHNNHSHNKTVIQTVSVREALQHKEFVALYFGAHWSSVSTKMTPHLIDFEQQANSKNAPQQQKQHSTLQVIYVSSDQTQEEFQQHFVNQMPSSWLSVVSDTPEQLAKKNELIPLFKAFRVPCMVVLHGPTGQFVTEHGMPDIQKCTAASMLAVSNKKDDDPPVGHETVGLSVSDILEQWRTTPTKSIQQAHSLIDYGGGTMSVLTFAYQNPYAIIALVALVLFTPLMDLIKKQPAILIAFLFLGKRYLTPKGDQNLPGELLTTTSVIDETNGSYQ